VATSKQVLILGAGFGGLASANLLRKSLSQEECQITVIDKNQYFMMSHTIAHDRAILEA
jgi:NADH dehydrogenase FAD-containing subunit